MLCMQINYFTDKLFKKIYFYFFFTKFQLFLNIDFYFTVHNYYLIEPIFSEAKTDCLGKGRLSDKQTSV